MTRWWPPVAMAAMLVLGLAVRHGPTPVDSWFQALGRELGPYRRTFLLFTDWRWLTPVLLVAIVVVLWRRQWWLAAAMAVSPPLAIAVARLCKHLFGREKGGALAYPSGHATFVVVVMGMVLIAAGFAAWAVVVAVTISVLGMFGQAITHHYFTDTVGAALLATSVVCVAYVLTRPTLDRCQPRCDVGHKRWLT